MSTDTNKMAHELLVDLDKFASRYQTINMARARAIEAASAGAGVPDEHRPLILRLLQDERDHLALSAARYDMLGPADLLAGIQAKLRAVDAALTAMDAAPAQRAAPANPWNAVAAEQHGAGEDALAEAARFAADVLAELYTRYSIKIGPFASQAQLANVKLGTALRALAACQTVRQEPVRAPDVMDLAQFREAVEHWRRDLLSDYKGGHIDDGGAAMAKADHLLALTSHTDPPAQAVPEDVRRDAERYRWLRDASPTASLTTPSVMRYTRMRCGEDDREYLDGEALDQAIDAARGAHGVQD